MLPIVFELKVAFNEPPVIIIVAAVILVSTKLVDVIFTTVRVPGILKLVIVDAVATILVVV
jgi:hypothetical protein